jgi:hypothetical protein
VQDGEARRRAKRRGEKESKRERKRESKRERKREEEGWRERKRERRKTSLFSPSSPSSASFLIVFCEIGREREIKRESE